MAIASDGMIEGIARHAVRGRGRRSGGRSLASDETGFAVLDAERDGDEIVLVGPIAHLEERERVRDRAARGRTTGASGCRSRSRRAEPLAPVGRGRAARLPAARQARRAAARATQLLDALRRRTCSRRSTRDPRARVPRRRAEPEAHDEAVQSWDGLRSTPRAAPAARAARARLARPAHRTSTTATRAHRVVRERPYELTSVFGVGFQTADTIARAAGVARRRARRARARRVLHVLARGRARRLDLPAGRRARHARRRAARRRAAGRRAARRDGRRRASW